MKTQEFIERLRQVKSCNILTEVQELAPKLKDKIKPEEFIEILGMTENKFQKLQMVEVLKSKLEGEITPENFIKILRMIHVNSNKVIIAKALLKHDTNEETKYKNFKHIIKSGALDENGFGIYDYQATAYLYYAVNLPKKRIPSLCKELFQENELSQTDLFCEFILKGVFLGNPTENIPIIKNFIIGLVSDNKVIEILQELQKKNIHLAEKDILKMVGGRIHSQYESLAGILKSEKPLNQLLTPYGLKTVKNLFGANCSVSLASLFSYYDIKGETSKFVNILQPEIIDKIRADFKLNNTKTYLTLSEYNTINALIPGLEMPKVAILTAYFNGYNLQDKKRVPDIPKFDASEANYNINFPENLCTDKKKKEIQGLFNSLLLSTEPTKENVAKLFNEILNLEVDTDPNLRVDINPTQHAELKNFFVANKDGIAYLFTQEGGLHKLRNMIYSLDDGCIANIGTQIRGALNMALIIDDCDRVLYQVFSDDMALKMLNDRVSDHLGASAKGTNPLGCKHIDEHLISIPGFAAKLQGELLMELEDGSSRATDTALSIIKTKFGEEGYIDFLHKVSDHLDTLKYDSPDFFKAQADLISVMATCIIIEKALPDIFKHKQFADFKTKYEGIIKNNHPGHQTSAVSASSGLQPAVESTVQPVANVPTSSADSWQRRLDSESASRPCCGIQ